MKVKQYINHQFESSCDKTTEYAAFERQCRKELKAMGKEAGFNLHAFNPNHFEWSAVLEKDGKFIYVGISDVRFWKDWYNKVLIRTMAHAEDWRGGANNYCRFDEIGSKATSLWERMN